MGARPVTIIGGGLAGLTLGIGLRRHGVPVRVLEAGHYPRHRVCGEFVSGRGQGVLASLGLLESLQQAGAVPAQTARFFFGARALPARRLPQPALCLSRYELDAALARAFREAGGELEERAAWREGVAPEGFVRASGRRAVPVEAGWRWFGAKAHVKNVALTADLEMHCFPGGYVGLCRLPAGQVNACGIFRRSARRHPGVESATDSDSREDLLRGQPGSVLHERLGGAQFEPGTFCSVAGLPLRPQRAAGQPECRIGDALTMIPPVTGNGMSMAFEAADLALEPLTCYSRGAVGWGAAQRRVAGLCDAAFAPRLRWAARLQSLLLHRASAATLIPCLLRVETLWRFCFASTR